MNQVMPQQARKTQGRPVNKTRSEVAEKLLEAAEILIQKHGHLQATERKIAAAAGVHEKMIHYYFGSKDGLLFEIVDRYSAAILSGFESLRNTTDWHHREPVRHIIETLIKVYYAKPWLGRIIVSEVAKDDSGIKDMFLKRYGAQGLVEIRRLLETLIKLKIYDPKINTTYTATCLYSILISPLFVTQISTASGIGFEDFRTEGWIDYVADLFDRQMRRAETPSDDVSIRQD